MTCNLWIRVSSFNETCIPEGKTWWFALQVDDTAVVVNDGYLIMYDMLQKIISRKICFFVRLLNMELYH
jgi:hypothetical protein